MTSGYPDTLNIALIDPLKTVATADCDTVYATLIFARPFPNGHKREKNMIAFLLALFGGETTYAAAPSHGEHIKPL